MKKTLTRMMSLLLVLVMMLGVMPTAFAANGVVGTISASGNTTVAPGTPVTVTASVTISENDAQFVDGSKTEFTFYVNGVAAETKTSGTSATFTYTPPVAGNYEITASYVVPKWTEESDGHYTTGDDNKDTCVGSVAIKAADSYTIDIAAPAKTTLYPGDKLNLSATANKNGAADPDAKIEWSVSGNPFVTIVPTGELTVNAAANVYGDVVVTATYKVGSDVKASKTLNLTIEEKGFTVTVDPASAEVAAGNSKQLIVKVVGPDGKEVAGAASYIDWSKVAGSSKITVTNTGKVEVAKDAVKDETAVIRASYVANGKTYYADCTVKVIEETYLVAIKPENPVVAPGKTLQMSAEVTGPDGQKVSRPSITWGVTGNENVSISSSGLITAKAGATGTATIKATYTKAVGETYEGTITLTIAKGTVKVNDIKELASTTAAIALNPTFSGTGYTADMIEWKFTEVSKRGTIGINATTGAVTHSGAAVMLVKVEALDKSTKAVLADAQATVSFYTANNVEVTMASGATKLTFGTSADIKESGSLMDWLLLGYTGTTAQQGTDDIQFSGLDTVEGKLGGSNILLNKSTVSGCRLVTFTTGSLGKAVFTYQIIPGEISSGILTEGTITINYDGKMADIEYSTTYDKKITFLEADFAKFWKDAKMTGNLSYVQFGISSTYPGYGTLYTTTSSTAAAYKATYSDKFYYGIVAAGGKDLGALTYVPQYNKLNTYDVTVPFTAYGTTGEKVTGNVIIHMNPQTNAITSRGIYFGLVYDKGATSSTLDDKTYAEQMADIFFEKTNKVLDSVVFTLPAPEKATLYARVPTNAAGNTLVAQGTHLAATKRVTVDAGTTSGVANIQLKNVYLIPAAGFSGPLTITFTGFGPGESTGTECSITFDVKSKTASSVFSDVTAKNYSWASDSVDFLYYEGTAQGSNGKYNPAAKITRRDFMLMLYRAFLAEDYGTFVPTTNFPDVVKGTDSYSKEIYQAVGVAKYLGIAQGTNDRFNPTANITRQEAMVLIYRTLDTINKDLRTESNVKLTSMKDYAKISSWATTAIANLVGHGVIQGNNDNIKPLDSITRAEMAAILHRVITY